MDTPLWLTPEQLISQQITEMRKFMADQFAQLNTDETNLVAGFTAMQTAITTALKDLQDQVANLKATVPNIGPQLVGIESVITNLAAVTTQATSADPGPQPAPTPPPATTTGA